MHIKSPRINPLRMARNLTLVLTVTRWIIIAGLIVLVPAMLFAFAAPGEVSRAVIADGAPGDIALVQANAVGLVMIIGCLTLGVALIAASKLRLVLRSVAAGDPFADENAGRVRSIALAMAGLALVPLISAPLIPEATRRAMESGSAHFNFGLWLGALVVLVLAEVFREGARLRDDAEMTV